MLAMTLGTCSGAPLAQVALNGFFRLPAPVHGIQERRLASRRRAFVSGVKLMTCVTIAPALKWRKSSEFQCHENAIRQVKCRPWHGASG